MPGCWQPAAADPRSLPSARRERTCGRAAPAAGPPPPLLRAVAMLRCAATSAAQFACAPELPFKLALRPFLAAPVTHILLAIFARLPLPQQPYRTLLLTLPRRTGCPRACDPPALHQRNGPALAPPYPYPFHQPSSNHLQSFHGDFRASCLHACQPCSLLCRAPGVGPATRKGWSFTLFIGVSTPAHTHAPRPRLNTSDRLCAPHWRCGAAYQPCCVIVAPA